MSIKVYVSLGSNVAEGKVEIEEAFRFLDGVLDDTAHSSIYVTAPLSGIGANYRNAVTFGWTDISAEELSKLFKEYERSRGRRPEDKEAGRVVVDLDLVIYGDKVLRERDASCDFFVKGYNEIR